MGEITKFLTIENQKFFHYVYSHFQLTNIKLLTKPCKLKNFLNFIIPEMISFFNTRSSSVPFE